MKNRVIVAVLVATITFGIFVTSSCAKKSNENNNHIEAVTSQETIPLDLTIDSGDINNKTGLKTTYKLNNSNGKYVNLYIENKGNNSVVATINNGGKRTFGKGEKGHISLEVTQGFCGGDNEYEFEVLTGKNGGTVNIYYEITQQNSKSV